MVGYTLRLTHAKRQLMKRRELDALLVLKHICASHPMGRALVLVLHTTFLYIEDAITPKIKVYNLPCILQTECYTPKRI